MEFYYYNVIIVVVVRVTKSTRKSLYVSGVLPKRYTSYVVPCTTTVTLSPRDSLPSSTVNV